jgi:hypothetical protein
MQLGLYFWRASLERINLLTVPQNFTAIDLDSIGKVVK